MCPFISTQHIHPYLLARLSISTCLSMPTYISVHNNPACLTISAQAHSNISTCPSISTLCLPLRPSTQPLIWEFICQSLSIQPLFYLSIYTHSFIHTYLPNQVFDMIIEIVISDTVLCVTFGITNNAILLPILILYRISTARRLNS